MIIDYDTPEFYCNFVFGTYGENKITSAFRTDGGIVSLMNLILAVPRYREDESVYYNNVYVPNQGDLSDSEWKTYLDVYFGNKFVNINGDPSTIVQSIWKIETNQNDINIEVRSKNESFNLKATKVPAPVEEATNVLGPGG